MAVSKTESYGQNATTNSSQSHIWGDLLGRERSESGAAVPGSQSDSNFVESSFDEKTWKLVGYYAELHHIMHSPVLVNPPPIAFRCSDHSDGKNLIWILCL